MKLKSFLCGALLLFCTSLFSQLVDDEITYLINSGDYLNLAQRYAEEKKNISNKTIQVMAEAFIKTASNKPEEATRLLYDLITHHQEGLGINGITACMTLLAENLRYEGKYATAAELIKSYVDQTDTFNGLDNNTRNFFMGLHRLGVLGDLMKPEINRPARNCEIPIILKDNDEEDGLMKNTIYTKAVLNGREVLFSLDTGCEAYATNFVTEKFARENGIRILQDSVILYGVDTGYAKLGVADRIKIGDITYQNVAFTVGPGDNILPVDSIQLDAVLGSVFFKAMGECQILPKEKKIIFPIRRTAKPASGSNMMLRGGQSFIESFSNEERLLLHYDTGAGYSALSSKYYEEHEDEVKSAGTLKQGGGIGGFGGMKYIDKYILNDFSLTIGQKTIGIPDMAVMTEEAGIQELFDGTLGNDLLINVNKVTINYEDMFLLID